jgi:hypothetical protein
MTNHTHYCTRCGGMMVETYDDLVKLDDVRTDVIGWRCVNCGDYVDELVLQNRVMQQGAAPYPIRFAKGRAPLQRSAPLSIQRRRAVA